MNQPEIVCCRCLLLAVVTSRPDIPVSATHAQAFRHWLHALALTGAK